MTRLAILGTGRLGEAVLRGLLAAQWIQPTDVVCTARRTERAEMLTTLYGVGGTVDNAAAVADAEIVLLALKPQTLLHVLADVADAFHTGQTVISLAAGTSTASIERLLPGDVPVVRVMTNTPVQVDEAMSVIAAGAHAQSAHLSLAEEILGNVGAVLRLPEEHLNAVTALSGSGPAYFFLLVEAMIDAGILLGLPRDVSQQLIVQTMVGSAKMLAGSGAHPVQLREQVTSPGGTTIAAIRELESSRVRAAFLNAIEAARDRADELDGL